MRDDHLKRHISLKHGEIKENMRGQSREEDKNPKHEADRFETEELDLQFEDNENMNVRLKFELVLGNEMYKKNVEIGKQISMILKSKNIPEKSLSKQNKFCLDLFRAQQPTTDVDTAELRLWQMQLLDVINVDEMDDRKII